MTFKEEYERRLRMFLSIHSGVTVPDDAEVTVTSELDPGFNCCGGSDPDCYCSMVTGPESRLEIKARWNPRMEPAHAHTRSVVQVWDEASITLRGSDSMADLINALVAMPDAEK